ncbi:MAG: 23S rRNA (uracil(1939)-C(5))-methyltransferase RlmD [Eggerthellaceae bacterium]|jgi:23S rRNA (uracil1939-C5)-methyltransferase|nr:23S rRNA (uracil(1939)-C(5))-methyltransferase RlmD [Eggerthellaceae bacterium]
MTERMSIDSLTYGAAGIGRDETGRAVFVDESAPGDVVDVAIDTEKKRYACAHIDQIITPSPQRIEPRCPHAHQCGGCTWQHIAYQAQLQAKRANVMQALTHIAHVSPEEAQTLTAECIPSKREFGYRNKLELATSMKPPKPLVVGFHQSHSHQLEPADSCPLAVRTIEHTPKALRGALRYLQGSNDLGIYRIGVRSSLRTHSTEIALWTSPGPFPRAAAAKTLSSTLKTSSIVRIMANPGKSRKIKGVEVLSGAGHWVEELHGFNYCVSAPSFFQVNTAQADKLIDLVIEGLQIDSSMRVADLYCGVGTFTLPIAQLCNETLAVESAASSVRDLRRNAQNAKVDIEIVGGDSARELPTMGHLDALVVDPPQTGLADGVAQDIAHANPHRVAYVSCNPSTWARDIVRLGECGYKLIQATPVDLFPQTYHVETVSILERTAD